MCHNKKTNISYRQVDIAQAKIAAISEVVSVLIQSIKEGEDVDLNLVKKQVFVLMSHTN